MTSKLLLSLIGLLATIDLPASTTRAAEINNTKASSGFAQDATPPAAW